MRRTRIVLMVSLLTIAPILSACEDFDPENLDIFKLNEKKKIPGERKPLFPEGVPGVSQGVPPDLVKGYQRPPEATPAEVSPQQKAAEAEKPKPKPKTARKPKPSVASQPTQIRVQPAAQDSSASQPQPNWPASQQAQPAQSGVNAPWPASPAPGTFQR